MGITRKPLTNPCCPIVGVPGGSWAASDAVNLPWAAGGVSERKNLGEAVANNPGDAED
nr:hypothetical protein Iba_chr06eCG1510 [Ipomoea batatas]